MCERHKDRDRERMCVSPDIGKRPEACDPKRDVLCDIECLDFTGRLQGDMYELPRSWAQTLLLPGVAQ